MLGQPAEAIHRIAKELRRVSPEQAMAEGFHVVTISRNPYDRLVSIWQNKVKEPHVPRTQLIKLGARRDGDTFGAFVRFVERVGVYAEGHLVPQTYYTHMRNGLPSFHQLGRFEDLAAFWEGLQGRFPGLGPLYQTNPSGYLGDYRDAYSRQTRAIVRRLYSRDLALLGYSF